MFTGMKDGPKMGEAEKRKLKEVVTEVEKAVEKAEDLVIENFEDGNDLKEKIVEKYGNIFGVENVYIYDPSNPPLDKSGNPINANGVNVDGIIYLNQNFVNTGDMKEINRVVGEEAGEIKAIKGGMWNQTTQDGTPAVETIGRIIGQAVESESTNKINDAVIESEGVDWSKIGSVDGTDVKYVGEGVEVSIGSGIYGGGNIMLGVATGDNGETKPFVTITGLGGAGYGGKKVFKSVGGVVTGIDDPNDLEGISAGINFGLALGFISLDGGFATDTKSVGIEGGIGKGVAFPTGHIALEVNKTKVFDSMEDAKAWIKKEKKQNNYKKNSSKKRGGLDENKKKK